MGQPPPRHRHATPHRRAANQMLRPNSPIITARLASSWPSESTPAPPTLSSISLARLPDMSSTLCIDPLLLSSSPAAAPWLAAARPLSPPAELQRLISSLSAASWGDDYVGPMRHDVCEPIQSPTAFSSSQSTSGVTAPGALTPPGPEAASPSTSNSRRSSQRQQTRVRAGNGREPPKTRSARRRRSEGAGEQRSPRGGGQKAAPLKVERQSPSPPPPTPGTTDEDEVVLSSGESDTITVASPTARASLTQRQRNRLAASKSRRKKDIAVKQLELDERAIARHHGYLLAQASSLESQVLALKSLLLEHQGCSCHSIRQYLCFHEPT